LSVQYLDSARTASHLETGLCGRGGQPCWRPPVEAQHVASTLASLVTKVRDADPARAACWPGAKPPLPVGGRTDRPLQTTCYRPFDFRYFSPIGSRFFSRAPPIRALFLVRACGGPQRTAVHGRTCMLVFWRWRFLDLTSRAASHRDRRPQTVFVFAPGAIDGRLVDLTASSRSRNLRAKWKRTTGRTTVLPKGFARVAHPGGPSIGDFVAYESVAPESAEHGAGGGRASARRASSPRKPLETGTLVFVLNGARGARGVQICKARGQTSIFVVTWAHCGDEPGLRPIHWQKRRSIIEVLGLQGWGPFRVFARCRVRSRLSGGHAQPTSYAASAAAGGRAGVGPTTEENRFFLSSAQQHRSVSQGEPAKIETRPRARRGPRRTGPALRLRPPWRRFVAAWAVRANAVDCVALEFDGEASAHQPALGIWPASRNPAPAHHVSVTLGDRQ